MGLRVLVADDEEVNRLVLGKIVSPFGKVDLARDGHEVIAAWKEARDEGEPYDLILLDIMMPLLDGHSALSQIRAQEEKEGLNSGQQVKVAMVTSLKDWDNALASFKKGVEEYITKPIERVKVIALLESLKLI